MLRRAAKVLKVGSEYLVAPAFGPKMECFTVLLEKDKLVGCIVMEINDRPVIIGS